MPIHDRLGKAREVDYLRLETQEDIGLNAGDMGDLARRYRDRLVREVNLEELIELPVQLRRTRVETLVAAMVRADGLLPTPAEREFLVRFIVNDVIGLGPLEKLMTDPSITEIMVNGKNAVYIERNGRLEPRPDVQFSDESHILHIIDRIVSPLGRRVDESSPMVDARLPDGSRVNAIIPPLSLNGPVLTIRRFRKDPFTAELLVQNGALTWSMIEFLRACVIAKQNLVVSGGTGSGKTTLLNVLASFVPPSERIITVEDSAELQFHLQHPHVLRQEARPANVEGKGEVPIRQLVRNSLRMRPDRIIVGEVRGAEALDMLQAMNTGHEGSMTTVHANSPMEAFSRLETMVMWAEGASELPLSAIREHLVAALDIVIQQERFPDARRVVNISEVQGVRKGQVVVKPIFVYERYGIEEKSGKILGKFTPTGHIPKCLPQLKAAGVPIDPSIFQPEHLIAEMGEALLEAEDVTEIMVNGPSEVFIEKAGKLVRRDDIAFRDEAHLRSVINMIIAPLGRRLDESSPMVDARLPDGSRINAVLPPVAVNGPVLTIRRFPARALTAEDLLNNGTLTTDVLAYLRAAVQARINLLVSGGTGSGKTTMLNVLSGFIPADQRIVTIEDVAELQLQQPHVVRLESRPADEDGENAVTIRQLVTNALRMRPDRIIVGEVRNVEALDMLQAMNTGHDGSMTTIHANSPEDAFSRLETMVMWAGTSLTSAAIREQIVGAIEIVVQQTRLADGRRCLEAVSEVSVAAGGVIKMQPLFVFRREGVKADGTVIGKIVSTGNVSRLLEHFRARGLEVPRDIFKAA